MKGNLALLELVEQHGFDVAFAMLGGSNAPWIGAGVARGSLRLVKTRHEDAAIAAAAGYARSTARPALASVTRGPGLTNAVTALIDAVKGHSPVLVITGEAHADRLPSQDIDQRAIVEAAGAGFHVVDRPEELAGAFSGAMGELRRTATPQVLAFHSALFSQDIPLDERAVQDAGDGDEAVVVPDAEIEALVELIAASRHPLLLAGGGAHFAGCRDDLVALAEASGARLATTLRALNLFAGHPADLGLCGGWAPPPAREQLELADLVVAVGASLNDFTTDGGRVFPRASVVQLDSGAGRADSVLRADVAIRADAREVVPRLLSAWRASGYGSGAREWRQVPPRSASIEAVLAPDLGGAADRGIDPRALYARLDEVLPENRVIVTDVGRFLGTLPIMVSSAGAESWHVGNAYSAVGLGLGTALGAAAAFSDRPVVLVVGDGGFMMSSHDLDAVRLNGLSLVVVIVDDELYGSDVKYLSQHDLPVDILRQDLPDVKGLAAAFGGVGRVIRSLDELDAVDWQARGLTLVDVRVDPQVNVRGVMAAWAGDADSRVAFDAGIVSPS